MLWEHLDEKKTYIRHARATNSDIKLYIGPVGGIIGIPCPVLGVSVLEEEKGTILHVGLTVLPNFTRN